MAGLFLVLVGFVILANYRINRSASRERDLVDVQLAERRSAEGALKASNERLQDALNALHSTQEQAVRQRRMHALGLMASGIGHDLNNTLSPILGYSDLMLNHPELLDNKKDVRRMLELINTSAVDASEVISRMRQFYKLRADDTTLEPVDLNVLVRQIVDLTRPNWQNQAQAKGIEIEVATDLSDVPTIHGSASEIREILINMVINAVDAMPEGGTLTLRTHSAGKNVEIEVADTGTGMTDEVREQCFKLFFSTKGERGTGLGLGVAQGIVRRHGGVITVESELGEGTTFKIRLPVAEGAEPKTPPEEPLNGNGEHRSLKVLLVDDDPRGRGVIAEYLRADGHSVVTAEDGAIGFDTFRKGDFDVVITDMAMPGMNGDRLASAVKSLAPDTPVILLTGFGNLMDPDLETPKDVDVLLSKPASVEKIRDALAKVAPQPLTTS
jgi:signal transduction histidine kinase/CheY-like chemotaxis protein